MDEGDDDTQKSSVDNYTGVSIKVRYAVAKQTKLLRRLYLV